MSHHRSNVKSDEPQFAVNSMQIFDAQKRYVFSLTNNMNILFLNFDAWHLLVKKFNLI